MIGFPIVVVLKYFRSVGSFHGSILLMPITLFSEAATMIDTRIER
jgi:hypothetical protein